MKPKHEDTQWLRQHLKGKQIKGVLKDTRLSIADISQPVDYTIIDVLCYTDGYGPVWEFDLQDSLGTIHEEVFTLSSEDIFSILSV